MAALYHLNSTHYSLSLSNLSQLLSATHTPHGINPRPMHHLDRRPLIRVRRIIETKIKERRLLLHPYSIVQHLQHERQIMVRHLILNVIDIQVDPNHARQLAVVAHIVTTRIRCPHAQPRSWHLPEEPEFAFEEVFGEAGLCRHGAVLVSDGELVGVAAVGGSR